jgi:CsoR family transcriptional regulator, copper-sensing transcriptional repressor
MSQHKRKQVAMRVKRIQGHVHAISEMLDEGRSYSEVVHQLTAVRAALDGAIQVIIDDLVEDCVAKMGQKEPFEDSMLELRAVVGKLR